MTYFLQRLLWMLLYIKSGNVATVLWHCTLSVFALCKHCSGNSALVSPLFFFFLTLLFKFCTVTTVPSGNGTVATVVSFFQSSVCIFFLIYCCTDTTNFIIFSQLLKCQFLISQNKIIKYKIVTNHN